MANKILDIIVEPTPVYEGSTFRLKVRVKNGLTYEELKRLTYEELKAYTYQDLKGDNNNG